MAKSIAIEVKDYARSELDPESGGEEVVRGLAYAFQKTTGSGVEQDYKREELQGGK
jgi:hypothetical protein